MLLCFVNSNSYAKIIFYYKGRLALEKQQGATSTSVNCHVGVAICLPREKKMGFTTLWLSLMKPKTSEQIPGISNQ